MPATLIQGGSVLTEDGFLRGADVFVEGRTIRRIATRIARKGAKLVSARGRRVVPGLIDTQINGGFGKSFGSASADGIAEVGRRLLAHGVTSYLPTLISMPHDVTVAAIGRLCEAAKIPGSARILGIHLEGPFLNPAKCGAHRPEFLRAPTVAIFDELRRAADGRLRMMTLAPELPGAFEIIRGGARSGIVMAAGHSMATAEQVRRAFLEAGLRHVTHVFNAMAPLHHREESILNAALILDGLSCGMIYDRHHLSLGTATLLLRVKPVGSLVLVSDATAALEAPDGAYEVDGTRYVVEGGTIRVEGNGRLGGSVCSLLHCVRRLAEDAEISLELALFMASGAPARVLGIGKKAGGLRAGAAADLLLLDRSLDVRKTMVEGEWRFER